MSRTGAPVSAAAGGNVGAASGGNVSVVSGGNVSAAGTAAHAGPGALQVRVAVVGAGIIGCCIAHALQVRGASVTLFDRDEPGSGCSYGNSGAISESSVAPLALPGVLSSIPAMLLDRQGPLYLPLAHLPRAMPWLVRFVASAREARVLAAAQELARLHAGAIVKHEAFARALGVPELILKRGHLHVYPDGAALKKDAASWDLRTRFGFRFEQLDRAGILDLEPGISSRYNVGIFLPDHATILNPLRYVQAIARDFMARGGRIRRQKVSAAAPAEGGGWQLLHTGTAEAFDRVVIAAGAWSDQLLKPLGIRLGLQSQRGYHVQFQGGPQVVTRTVVLVDRKIFVTPMEEGVRVGGTVEIGGLVRPPDPRRAELLARIALDVFPELAGTASSTWMGHRPCTPTSVPFVGPAAGRTGLWIAAGHGHLGMTDALGTAERIAEGMLSGAYRDP